MDSAYELFRNGTRLLEEGNFHAATVPLARARDLEPDKCSIREALGRALFGSRRYAEAAEEFGVVAERAPTNDYALFCLGRSLQLMGRHAEARRPLALAANLRPERARLPPVPRPLAAPRGGVALRSGACARRRAPPPPRPPAARAAGRPRTP